MFSQRAIHALDQGRILAHCGTVKLVISARVGRLPQRSMCILAAREAFAYLDRLAAVQEALKRRVPEITEPFEDPLVEAMVQSARDVSDDDLTPMAAVAGALADAVADFLFTRGMTVVLVENGTDAAIRIGEPASVMVGIRPDVGSDIIGHMLELDDTLPSWGVATSGFGGHGLTRGIAASATVVAEKASTADAAATSIANATYVAGDEVKQRPAEELEPSTDIRGRMVTCRVGSLTNSKISRALAQAMQLSDRLIGRRVILGALVTIQGRMAATGFFERRLVPAWPFS